MKNNKIIKNFKFYLYEWSFGVNFMYYFNVFLIEVYLKLNVLVIFLLVICLLNVFRFRDNGWFILNVLW